MPQFSFPSPAQRFRHTVAAEPLSAQAPPQTQENILARELLPYEFRLRVGQWAERAGLILLGGGLSSVIQFHHEQLSGPPESQRLFFTKTLPIMYGPALLGVAHGAMGGASCRRIIGQGAVGAMVGSLLLQFVVPSASSPMLLCSAITMLSVVFTHKANKTHGAVTARAVDDALMRTLIVTNDN